MDVVHAFAVSREKAAPCLWLCGACFASRVIRGALVMMKRSKEGIREMQYTSDIGRSTVTELVLRSLVDVGKLESLAKVRAPG